MWCGFELGVFVFSGIIGHCLISCIVSLLARCMSSHDFPIAAFYNSLQKFIPVATKCQHTRQSHAYKELWFHHENNTTIDFFIYEASFFPVILLFLLDLGLIALLQAVFSGCCSNFFACVDFSIFFVTNCSYVQISQLVKIFHSLFKQAEYGV